MRDNPIFFMAELRIGGHIIDDKNVRFYNAPLHNINEKRTRSTVCFVCDYGKDELGDSNKGKYIKIYDEPKTDEKDFTKHKVAIYWVHEMCILDAIRDYREFKDLFKAFYQLIKSDVKETARDESWDVVEQRLNGPD